MLFVKNGDAKAAYESAALKLEQEYTTSINIHAPLEPPNLVATFEGDTLPPLLRQPVTVPDRGSSPALRDRNRTRRTWCSTSTLIGGGFGRKPRPARWRWVAALTTKAVGKPVKVIYSPPDRHDDGLHPAAYIPESAVLPILIKTLETQYPGVKVVNTSMSLSDQNDKLPLAFAKGSSAPDVSETNEGLQNQGRLVADGELLPLRAV